MDEFRITRLVNSFAVGDPLTRRGLAAVVAAAFAALGYELEADAKKKKKKKKKKPACTAKCGGKTCGSNGCGGSCGTCGGGQSCNSQGQCTTIYEFITAFGDGSGPGDLENPWDVAVDSEGNVYVTHIGFDVGEDFVKKFDNEGNFLTSWQGGAGGLSDPAGIAVAGNAVFVVDQGNNRIQKFDSGGTFLTQWGGANGGFEVPGDVAVDSDGNVYVTDTENHRVQKFAPNTLDPLIYDFVDEWASEGTGDGEFTFPLGVAIDSDDNVYVSDGDIYGDEPAYRIQKFTSAGVFLTKWGSTGTGNGQFDSPQGIAIDWDNNVFVGDTFNDRIQKFANDGTFLTAFGAFGDGNGEFKFSRGVAVDADGSVFATDTFNNRAHKWSPAGGAPRLLAESKGRGLERRRRQAQNRRQRLPANRR